MNTASLLCQRFPAARPQCVGLGNPDKSDFRERYDFMSVMLTMGLFVRRHSISLLIISTDLPAGMTWQPRPDWFFSSKCFTIAKAHLAICTNRPSLFFDSLHGALRGIRSLAKCFTLLARATVAGSPSHLNRTCFVKESLNEFDQSSGRVVSSLLSHQWNDLDKKQV